MVVSKRHFIFAPSNKNFIKMTSKEKIIKRLNDGFGMKIPNNVPYCHHQATFCADGRWSWSISNGSHDIGSTASMKECLSWERWVLSVELGEISEYIPNAVYQNDDIIETI